MIQNVLKYLENIKQYIIGYEKISVEDKKRFGEVFTPQSLVEEMLDLYPEHIWTDETLKWLDPCCGVGNFEIAIIERYMEGLKAKFPDDWQRFEHILKNMIYFADISIKNIFILYGLFEESDIPLNVYKGDFLSKDFDDYMKNVWKIDTFEVIVGNPPYNNNIDLKFLSKYYDICSKYICIVHPSTWLFDKKLTHKKYVEIRNKIKTKLQKIVSFNGNTIFNIRIQSPTIFTFIDKQKNDSIIEVECKIHNNIETYNNIFDINMFNSKLFHQIRNKIVSKLKNIQNLELYKNKDIGSFYVELPTIRPGDYPKMGFTYKMDFYTIASRLTTIKNCKGKLLWFSFITEKEAHNFIQYIKTNFARMCLSLIKTTQHIDSGEMALVPYLDFTQEWTDERLYKHFELTEDEIKFIEKHIEPYYN